MRPCALLYAERGVPKSMEHINNICIFASSSELLEPKYFALAEELGHAVARLGAGMVFGGGQRGLMGAVARGVKEEDGRITGVIPVRLNKPGVAFEGCTEFYETETMHARKQRMEDLSDAFIALPGGFGTLEEVLEVITLRQLGYHDKPIIIINLDGFYDPLFEQFERLYAEKFADVAYRAMYAVACGAEEAIAIIQAYVPADLPDKLQVTEASV